MPARVLRRILVLFGLVWLTGCATETIVEVPKVVADTSDFVIVRGEAGDTLESLTSQYLKDPTLVPIVEDVNGTGSVVGKLVILPKTPVNPSGVDAGGYQVVPILCYHQFTRGSPRNRMQVSAADFEAQMAYLKQNDYRVITLSELEGFLSGERAIPKRAVVVTIDDGYKSVYEIAYPILERLGLRATLYIYSDFANISLSWDRIREMQASGVIDIQSHSKTHTSMSPNGDEKVGPAYVNRIEEEIEVPHRVLTNRVGTPMIHFAYPYGDTSAEAVELLEKYDYITAATVQRGGNASFTHPLLLRRDMVFSDHTIEDLKKFLTVYKKADLK